MKLILLNDVKKLGKKGEIVEVADGYGRNYLVANKLAVEVTKKSLEILESEKLQKNLEEKELESQAKEIQSKLEKIIVTIPMKSGKDGRIFGSVSSKQIVEQLQKQHNLTIAKKKFLHFEPICSLGYTEVKIDLYKNQVIGVLRVHVQEK